MSALATDRLILRPPALEDAAALARLAADPGVARMLRTVPCPNPPQAMEGWILLMEARAPLKLDQVFAVLLAGAGAIGIVGVHRKAEGAPFELGYWIGRPYWGRGYASEAVSALVAHVREHGAGLVEAGHFVDNPASGRVLEKARFAYTGEVVDVYSLARRQAAPCRRMRLSA